MTPLRRTILATAGSAVLHLSTIARLSCGFNVDIEMPDIEFELTEMDFVDPEQELGKAKPPEPPPEPEVVPLPIGPELPPDPDEYRVIPFSLGLVPPLTINHIEKRRKVINRGGKWVPFNG